ncbi:MAG: response regulator transcription factor [Acidobacteria bacterium]|nr:response regulator transcription factor [Acidobacteriota bacterium]
MSSTGGFQPSPRIRIGIATDEPITGRGLLSVLQEEGRYRAVWLPTKLDKLTQTSLMIGVDALFVDMACGFPASVANDLRAAGVTVPIILWARENEIPIARPDNDLTVGVLDKRQSPELLIPCIEAVRMGRPWAGSDSAGPNLISEPPPPPVHLSAREGELMRLVSEGLSNRQIAERLHLTEGSVKVYFSKLFRKLGVRDRVGLAVFALQHPWEAARVSSRGRSRLLRSSAGATVA